MTVNPYVIQSTFMDERSTKPEVVDDAKFALLHY
jgi:hypothetical protein